MSNMTPSALFDLTGKTALVTGSSQGIGLALARGLAEAGADFARLMAGKTLCTGCQTVHATAEEAASCCGATTLGFIAASRSARCSQCGAHFSDGAVDAEDTLEQPLDGELVVLPHRYQAELFEVCAVLDLEDVALSLEETEVY